MDTKIGEFFLKLRQALDQVTVGYDELKHALVSAYLKQSLGIRGGHVLVFGPTGTAKTRTVKGLASILLSVGQEIAYARIQGNPDMMTSDFLVRRTAEYGDDGRPKFVWSLQTIAVFERRRKTLPGLLQFDELDKVAPSGQFGLLQAMEEQQVSVADGRTVELNFVLVATANTRRFDPTAKTLSRAVQDRFGSVVALGYQTLEDDLRMLEMATSLAEPRIAVPAFPFAELTALRECVRVSGLPLKVSNNLKRGIVTAVKLTQQKLPGFTDFVRYIKVPAGPRAELDFFWEASIAALLAGADELKAEHCLATGIRVLRGRIETDPAAELEGMGTDVLISKILAEVFCGPFPNPPRA